MVGASNWAGTLHQILFDMPLHHHALQPNILSGIPHFDEGACSSQNGLAPISSELAFTSLQSSQQRRCQCQHLQSPLLSFLIVYNSKKNLLPKKLLSSSSNTTNPVTSSVPTAPAPTPTMTQTGGAPVAQSVPLSRMSAPQTMNTNVVSGHQTISSMPGPQSGALQLSDINDVIHTGTPNF